MVWKSFLAGVVATFVAIDVIVMIGATVVSTTISFLFASFSPKPPAAANAMTREATGTPVPLGEWFDAEKDVRIRVVSLYVVDSYDYGRGQVFTPAKTGTHIYILQLEGRFDGPAGVSASLDYDRFRALNNQRQVVYPDMNVNNARAFSHIVYGGGSGTGEVIFMADKLEGFYYQADDFNVDPIFLTVPTHQ